MRAPRIGCLDLDTFFVSVERLLDASLVGRPVIVGARPGHRDFYTVQRSRTRPPTADDLEVMRTARALLDRAWSRRMSIRLLGVGLSNLVGPDRQLHLPLEAELRSPSKAVDLVRQRYGFPAIRRGRAG